ncbi:hypothetical protein MMYC01_209451 [Madurella mycetomatis]|uniref:Chitin-binding type-4 domain-containing protein n=1 Tax=Madurella mycetomatis TaxID=100816 RepID=A0A175VR93_9PEZI|nr:hypothetical protein MMYC01_209451 [Madurella mycetomatis]
MHVSLTAKLGLVGLAAQASAHGLVQTPATRQPGSATEAACGRTMVQFYTADGTSYPEALLRANPQGLADGFDAEKCNLWLCKGYQFDDNTANVQSYKPGDVVDMEVYIRIPHRGHANTKFSITMPELEGKCTEPGACVIQWYWLGQGQTYESCIDFTVPAATEAPARRMRGRSRV